jgi:hypothetical protein
MLCRMRPANRGEPHCRASRSPRGEITMPTTLLISNHSTASRSDAVPAPSACVCCACNENVRVIDKRLQKRRARRRAILTESEGLATLFTGGKLLGQNGSAPGVLALAQALGVRAISKSSASRRHAAPIRNIRFPTPTSLSAYGLKSESGLRWTPFVRQPEPVVKV